MSSTPAKRKKKWLPLLVSAAVYPGGGQFIQGRPLAGLLFVFAFSASGLWMGWLALYPAFRNLQTALNGLADEFILPDWPRILISLGLCLTVYLGSLLDILLADRRAPEKAEKGPSPDLPGERD